MTERAVGGGFAIAVALVVLGGVSLASWSQPSSETVLELLGAPSPFERSGGLALEVRASRGGSEVTRRLELAGLSPAAAPELEQLLRDGVALRDLAWSDPLDEAHAAATSRDLAAAQKVRLITGIEDPPTIWRSEAHFLDATSRPALEEVLAAAAPEWSLPEGAMIAIGEDERGAWRAYALEREPLFIDEPGASPLRAEARTFGELHAIDLELARDSSAHADFCDSRQHSQMAITAGARLIAAVELHQLCGGAVVFLSSADATVERARMIAALLAHPQLSAGAVVVSTRAVPADRAALLVVLARLLLAIVLAAIAGLVTWIVLAVARPRWHREPPPPPGTLPWARLAVTALVPGLVLAASRISLPDVLMSQSAQQSRDLGLGGGLFSLPATDITFVLLAYVIVHLIARLPPLWRRRFTPPGRRVFSLAVVLVTLGIVVTSFWEQLADSRGMGERSADQIAALLGVGAALLANLGLVGLAWLVNARGLGNGFAVVLASEMLARWVGRLSSDYALDYLPLALATLVAAAFPLALLRWRLGGAEGRARVETPSSGDAPLSVWQIGLALLGARLIGAPLDLDFFQRLRSIPVEIALSLALMPLWAWLFARPSLVAAAAAAAGLRPPSRADAMRAAVVAFYFFLGLGVVRFFGGLSLADVSLATVAAATLLDVLGEARARRRLLALAATLHHIQRASLVEHVLGRAGIDFHLRSRNVRALLSFFGPYAPVQVLVPPERVDEARALLAAVVAPLPETIAPPAPPLQDTPA